jgi:hypothetical protein
MTDIRPVQTAIKKIMSRKKYVLIPELLGESVLDGWLTLPIGEEIGSTAISVLPMSSKPQLK